MSFSALIYSIKALRSIDKVCEADPVDNTRHRKRAGAGGVQDSFARHWTHRDYVGNDAGNNEGGGFTILGDSETAIRVKTLKGVPKR